MSNSLTRRTNNNALVPTNPRSFDAVDQWAGFGDVHQPQQSEMGEQNVEVLEQMAQKAKREAQGKRKGIPPFVQKLSR